MRPSRSPPRSKLQRFRRQPDFSTILFPESIRDELERCSLLLAHRFSFDDDGDQELGKNVDQREPRRARLTFRSLGSLIVAQRSRAAPLS